MESEFEVIWAKSAVKDLEEIIDYIAQDRPLTVRKLLFQIKERVKTLGSSPARGRYVPELKKEGILNYR